MSHNVVPDPERRRSRDPRLHRRMCSQWLRDGGSANSIAAVSCVGLVSFGRRDELSTTLPVYCGATSSLTSNWRAFGGGRRRPQGHPASLATTGTFGTGRKVEAIGRSGHPERDGDRRVAGGLPEVEHRHRTRSGPRRGRRRGAARPARGGSSLHAAPCAQGRASSRPDRRYQRGPWVSLPARTLPGHRGAPRQAPPGPAPGGSRCPAPAARRVRPGAAPRRAGSRHGKPRSCSSRRMMARWVTDAQRMHDGPALGVVVTPELLAALVG